MVLAGCALMGSLAGCSAVSVGTRSTSEAIMAQRVTVLTGDRLSEDTRTRLSQAGLDEPTCFANMPACLVAIRQASLTPNDKGLYGAYSELFYSAALQYKASSGCAADSKPKTDFAKNLLASPAELSNDPTKSTTERLAKNNPDTATHMPPKSFACPAVYNDNLLQAARFAYIYLMFDKLHPAPATTAAPLGTLPKERDIQVQDLYNAAINTLGNGLFEQKLKDSYDITDNHISVTYNELSPSQQNQPINRPETANTAQPTIDATKKPTTNNITNTPKRAAIEKLVSSYQLNLTGLNSISRRDGMGVNYVAIMDDRYTTSIRDIVLHKTPTNLSLSDRIHPLGHLPVTVILTPDATTLDTALTTNQFKLQIFDPYQYKTVSLFNTHYPLAANFSAPYGLWLKDNALGSVSLLNLLSANANNTQPQLFMLEPYNPNKRVIIMLHGLASSPETWIQLTNDIFNDPTLRDNFQVWQVFYPTNIPMLENRLEIEKLINATFNQVDPSHEDKASQHAVLIGHSMGAVLGRLMLSNDDLTPRLKTLLNDYDQNNNGSAPISYRRFIQNLSQADLSDRFQLHALPQIDRAVFVSAPFRGTSYADKWFTRVLRRIVQLPRGFVTTVSQNLTSILQEGEISQNPLGSLFLDNGASQLSDKSFFMQLTKDVKIADNVTYHSIIGSKDKDILDGLAQLQPQTPDPVNANHPTSDTHPDSTQMIPATAIYTPQNIDVAVKNAQEQAQRHQQISTEIGSRITDGIVPYASAHLDNAASEKVINGNHSIQTSPQAVLELRRILHAQLEQTNPPNPTTKDKQP